VKNTKFYEACVHETNRRQNQTPPQLWIECLLCVIVGV